MNSHGLKMSNEEYRKHEGISSSELKRMMKSPAHYKYWKDNPSDNDTPSLLFGRAAHKYILETYEFYKEFAVAPICDRRTKEGKEVWNRFLEESQGKDIITKEQFEQIDDMRNAMLATPFVSKLINGEHEVSFFWTDEDTGIKCKCRPDSLNEKLHILVDYKTTENAETESFMRKAIDLGYDLQASYYLDGVWANLECSLCEENANGYYEYKGKLYCKNCIEKALKDEYMSKIGNEYDDECFNEYLKITIPQIPYFENYIFVFIAQEKKPPYAVNILQADDMFLESGRQLYTSMLETYKECEETGRWHGYLGAENQINSLGVPKWMEKMFDTESEE